MSSDPERPLAACPWLVAAETRALLAALVEDGKACRFVGGCVRDSLLHLALDEVDLDIATQEQPEPLARRLAAKGYKVLPTGLKHGTITVLAGGRSYEVTTLRRDVQTFGRHAEVAFSEDFVEDAARRDFTVNAMSCDGEGRLFDPFAGRADLRAGRIRFVGDPAMRIREDYLRILRFFRFFARFGQGAPDAPAMRACAAEAAGIDRLSGERIRVELLKLLHAPRASDSIAAMIATGIAARFLPAPLALSTLERLVALAPASDALLRLAALLRHGPGPGHPPAALAERLRFSVRERERLTGLVLAELPRLDAPLPEHERLVLEAGLDGWRDRLRLGAAVGEGTAEQLQALEQALAAWPQPSFPLQGADLLARGIAQGPLVGRLLAQLRAWWMAERFRPDRAACIAKLDELLVGAALDRPPFSRQG